MSGMFKVRMMLRTAVVFLLLALVTATAAFSSGPLPLASSTTKCHVASPRGRGKSGLQMVDSVSSPLDGFRNLFQRAASGMTSSITAVGQVSASSKRAADLSEELKELLLKGLEAREFDRNSIDAIISELTTIGSKAFLSSGPWQAVYTKNSQPLWEKQAKYIPIVKNRAWQDYDLAEGRVVNVGQILSNYIWVSVQGAVSEQDTSNTTPKYYNADIERGALNILGTRLPLPIQGKGVAKLLYQDENLRVFESPKESESAWEQEGLIVVQMPIETVP